MDNVFFEARPIVLVVGMYSTGKTTFIQNLLGRDYPGIRIGAEPTTDKYLLSVPAATNPRYLIYLDS